MRSHPRFHYWHGPSAFAVALAVVFSQGPCARAADPTELKVGVSDAADSVLALYMAQAGGFYAAQGLKVDIRSQGGGSRGTEELAAGHLDVMHVGLSSVIKLNRAGSDLRLIASLANTNRLSLFVAPGVTSPADLKGGVVAVSTFGSESDTTATLALQRLGLTRDDVVVKEYSVGASRLAALKSGEVKATTISEPGATLAREQGLKPMVDLLAEHVPWIFSALVVKRSDLQVRRALLKTFLKATIEGAYLGLTDANLAKQVLTKEVRITDPRFLEIGYDEYKMQTPPTLEPSRQGADNILAQLPGGSSKLDDYIDRSLLDELDREGFFTEIQHKYGTR
jgi:ABC-type nitrate/sulfonate/bicarbonate transport system substrate-binding protein